MRMRWRVLLACVLTGMIQAQELLPEVAGAAAKYKAAVEALGKQKAEAVGRAAQSYVSALDGIEKTATAKGDVDLIAAVVKEREAALAGTLEEELPAALPKARLYGTRKALQKSVEKIGGDFARKGKQADADYLRALAGLQTKAAPGSELAKQVAAEKAAVLAGGADVGNGEAKGKKVSRGKNAVVNGDFQKVDADGKPEGWDWYSSTVFTLGTEKENNFIRFDGKPGNQDGTCSLHMIGQKLEMPKGAERVCIRAQLRTEKVVSPGKSKVPGIMIEFLDQKEKKHFRVATWDGKNGPWKEIKSEGPMPLDTISAEIKVLNGSCPGQIDFDEVEVTFK